MGDDDVKSMVASFGDLLRKRIDLLSRGGDMLFKLTENSQRIDYLEALDLASQESEVSTEIISTLMDVIAKLTHKLGASGVN